MRIDDLNRAPQAHDASKTEAVRQDGLKNESVARNDSDPDASSISGMAAALSPSELRLETLRLQVERGEYRPAATEVASKLIDEHTGGQ